MPAFVAHYSESAKQSLLRLVLGDGMAIAEVQRRAKAGDLPGVEPADVEQLARMSYNHACGLVRDERDERDGIQRDRAHPETVARETAVLLMRRARKDAERIANDTRKTPMDAGVAAQLVKVQRDCLALLGEVDKRRNGGKEGPASSSEPKRPQTIAQRIAAQARTVAGDAPTHTEESGDNGRAVPASEQASGQDNGDGGAVRANGGARAGLGGGPAVELVAGA